MLELVPTSFPPSFIIIFPSLEKSVTPRCISVGGGDDDVDVYDNV